jgi:hypothetical protein
MSNSITNKTEIVLVGDQFVRRITQEVGIGTQERFIKALVERQQNEILWSNKPTFNGPDIDPTGMVKRIWLGHSTAANSPTHVITELNYFPLCGATLEKPQGNNGYRLILVDRRKHPHDEYNDYGYTEEQMDDCLYFDEKPLRLTFQENHNAKVFLYFPLTEHSASTPKLFILRDGLPWIPYGLPNIFPDDGALCAGDDWEEDTKIYSSPSMSISTMDHIKKAIVAFSSTPPNSDLSNDESHSAWGSWDCNGHITPCGIVPVGNQHRDSTVCSFVKHFTT